jgi:hypothetical protein
VRYLPESTEKTHETLHSEYPVTGPIFEPETSLKKQDSCVNSVIENSSEDGESVHREMNYMQLYGRTDVFRQDSTRWPLYEIFVSTYLCTYVTAPVDKKWNFPPESSTVRMLVESGGRVLEETLQVHNKSSTGVTW